MRQPPLPDPARQQLDLGPVLLHLHLLQGHNPENQFDKSIYGRRSADIVRAVGNA
ncbi:hypothetical protein GCM10023067_56380 [Aminobacter aganoensis]